MDLWDCALFPPTRPFGRGVKFSPREAVWVGQASSPFIHVQLIQSCLDLLHLKFSFDALDFSLTTLLKLVCGSWG